MPQYYFGIETISQGGKPDPEKDRIIAIHYQKIDFRSGKPLQKIEILKEWESSEEAIVTRFYNKFFRGGQNKWIFIPVGFDLNQAWEYIDTKFEEYLGRSFVNKRFHYTIPHIDLDSMVVLLNKGNFIGAKLEKFTRQTSGKKDVKQWYENQEYEKIISHINTSAESFLVFFTKIKENVHRVLEDAPTIPKAPLPASSMKAPGPEPAPEPEVIRGPQIPPPPSQPPIEEHIPEGPPEPAEETTAPPEPEEIPPEPAEPVIPPEPEEAHEMAEIHGSDEIPEAVESHHAEEAHEIDVEHEVAEVHEVDAYHEAEEAHEVAEIHEEEVHEVTEIHDHDEHAEYAPEAIAVEAVEEHDEHAEAVEVEAVEEHDVHAEAVEVEAVPPPPPPPQRSLSPKELKKRLKEEAKQKKKEQKAKAKKK